MGKEQACTQSQPTSGSSPGITAPKSGKPCPATSHLHATQAQRPWRIARQRPGRLGRACRHRSWGGGGSLRRMYAQGVECGKMRMGHGASSATLVREVVVECALLENGAVVSRQRGWARPAMVRQWSAQAAPRWIPTKRVRICGHICGLGALQRLSMRPSSPVQRVETPRALGREARIIDRREGMAPTWQATHRLVTTTQIGTSVIQHL